MQDVPALVWALERNPSNFTPRASAPKWVSVVPRSVSVVPTPGHLVTSSALGTAVSGHIVIIEPKNKGQPQRPQSLVVSAGRSNTGVARASFRSQTTN